MARLPRLPAFERFTWDPGKCAANVAERGIDFGLAEDFDFASAMIVEDDRKDYGEVREIALGFIGQRLHVLVFTRRPPAIHIISLRKANAREVKAYEQAATKA